MSLAAGGDGRGRGTRPLAFGKSSRIFPSFSFQFWAVNLTCEGAGGGCGGAGGAPLRWQAAPATAERRSRRPLGAPCACRTAGCAGWPSLPGALREGRVSRPSPGMPATGAARAAAAHAPLCTTVGVPRWVFDSTMSMKSLAVGTTPMLLKLYSTWRVFWEGPGGGGARRAVGNSSNPQEGLLPIETRACISTPRTSCTIAISSPETPPQPPVPHDSRSKRRLTIRCAKFTHHYATS